MPKRIFVSSVTANLKEERAAVAAVLRRDRFDVSDQDTTFSQGGDVLLQKLYLELWRVDAAILLTGDLAGAYPPEGHEAPWRDHAEFVKYSAFTGQSHASYTQWEFLFAWGRHIPCYIFFDGRISAAAPGGRQRTFLPFRKGAREDRTAPVDEGQLAFRRWLKEIGKNPERFASIPDLREKALHAAHARPSTPVRRATRSEGTSQGLPGASPMTDQDRDLFFGRDREISLVGETLRERRFAAIVGGSGSGKTSLMQAGVLPGWTVPGRRGVPCRTMRPGTDPFSALARLFTADAEAARSLAEELRADPDLFGIEHKRHCEREDIDSVLIAIEQFEELFTLPDRTKRDFVRLIVQSLRGEAPGAERNGAPTPSFAITVRADFFHYCLEQPEFLEVLQTGIVLLGEPSGETVRHIVSAMAAGIGLDLHPTHVDEMVRDTEALSSGRLVMLGYMLRALHRHRNMRLNAATVTLYRQLGGIEGSIARSAGLAFDGFDAPAGDKQSALERLFAALVQVDPEGQALRRRARRSAFAEDEHALRLIALFADPDVALLSLSGDFVEITHETLFRRYTAYGAWIDDNREELVLAANAEKAAREWNEAGREADRLWPARKVADAVQKLGQAPAVERTLSADARAFLDPARMLEALAQELGSPDTGLPRRLEIGQTLAARPGGDGRPGVGLCADGTPDILWLPVPANPQIRVTVEGDFAVGWPVAAFRIGAYPVTCAQFRAFQASPGWDRDDWWGDVEPARREQARLGYLDNCPAAPLTWHHATAFARWTEYRLRRSGWPDVPEDWHVRLPTEWEWLQAATAGRDQPFPWGPDFAPACARSAAEVTQGSAVIPVGLFPKGASAAAALDMVGNVLEWAHNRFDESGGGDGVRRPIRGGRLEAQRPNPCAFRKPYRQSACTTDFGFRLVLAPGDPAALARLTLKD